jgi:hypothetical protein
VASFFLGLSSAIEVVLEDLVVFLRETGEAGVEAGEFCFDVFDSRFV